MHTSGMLLLRLFKCLDRECKISVRSATSVHVNPNIHQLRAHIELSPAIQAKYFQAASTNVLTAYYSLSWGVLHLPYLCS